MKICKQVQCYLLLGYLLLGTGTLLAQKERLDELVPYRKGKLWGLVHHGDRRSCE